MMPKSYDICVIGLGYIGLPTASIFATKGKRVLGVDVVPRIVETINRGEIHIQEPDLDTLVRAAVGSGNLRADTVPAPAEAFIIAVPTPFRRTELNPKAPDLRFVESATRSLASVVRPGNLVILESTSPVGTTDLIREWLAEEVGRLGGDTAAVRNGVLFAHCPERILPGQMLKELVTNDRICGGLTSAAAGAASALYASFCAGDIVQTDARTAEMCKLTENASRDVGIAFANELSLICERLGVDVWRLIELANRHPRVKILQPGPGVGGHCIAVDPWFIVDAAPDLARVIRTAREVNDSKPHHVVSTVIAETNKVEAPPVVACFGLSFKADVDDLRESPAVEICAALSAQVASPLLIVEPHVTELPPTLRALPNRPKLVTAPEALQRANVVALLVAHRSFRSLDRQSLDGKRLIDTCGLWK